jgi:UDP-N-acetylmuramate: L-alanyl-gamma-D-glutamyl-meso-diaminopimelate ligase
LVSTIPGNGLVITHESENNIGDGLGMGCWSPVTKTAINGEAQWQAQLVKADGSQFKVLFEKEEQGIVNWSLTGSHNVNNAMSAIAAAKHIGILPVDAINALMKFKSVKRRMEVIAKISGVTIYDDFAHHPTAIKSTLEGLRKQVVEEKIVAIVEPRSNTMRMGVHTQALATSLKQADLAIIYQPENLDWDLIALKNYADNIQIITTLDAIINTLKTATSENSHIVLMSNGSFGGIYQRLINEL